MERLEDASIGARVRGQLALRGLSGKDLGARLGLPQTSVSRRLRGLTRFSASEIAAIADWLQVPVSQFFKAASDGSDRVMAGARELELAANVVARGARHG